MPRPPTTGIARRELVLGAAVAALAPGHGAWALEQLKIGGERGTIDFSIGDSKLFRTTGSFKDWRGMVSVDDADVPKSTVDVRVNTRSIEMLDKQQTDMLKDADFFDVDKFPEMTFHSSSVERLGADKLKVTGEITLRGITKPMQLDVSVLDRKPDAPPGAPYARFRGQGQIKRSEFGMTKYIDVVGDTVDISIRADAWR
ncbi:YceI family protein [Reyranella sp.]|jgi:polyisoprenoid-binding protein YceI|uniref:YceI family protein n=1 Tax=Reyranella sp. TaxID=1929291 RepID=UPI002F91C501